MSADSLTILAQTLASCGLTGLLGLLLLRAVRRRPVVLVLVVAALVPVLAVAVSVVVNVQTMVISVPDSQAVLTALAVAMVVAVALAVVVGQWVVAGSTAVGHGLQRLGAEGDAEEDSGHAGVDDAPAARLRVPAELAALDEELRATRQRLEASRRRERSLESSRRELAAFLSHDLRSPLAGLRALAEGLEDGVVQDVPAALMQIRAGVDRMDGLVGDLLELSRLRTGPWPGAMTLVSLREVAQEIAHQCQDQARTAGVRLVVEADDRLTVHGAAEDLAHALSNMIRNALRHTGPGGAVLVRGTRHEDGRVRLAVDDGCAGVPAENLQRVFDTGAHAEAEGTPGAVPSALSLAIVRGVAEAHAGSLAVANTDQGCRLELTLPSATPGGSDLNGEVRTAGTSEGAQPQGA